MTSTKLDALVRQALLSYPSLHATRWDVLDHLYLTIGNGFEWRPGPDGAELVNVCEREPFDETRARAEFFRTADERITWRADVGDVTDDPDLRLQRARLQFQLDHLDDLVHESRINARVMGALPDHRMTSIATDYAYAFNVPDDAEPSFRAGAVEVLRELIPLLYLAEQAGTDRGLRAAAVAQMQRLDPQPELTAERQAAIDELLADLRVEFGDRNRGGAS